MSFHLNISDKKHIAGKVLAIVDQLNAESLDVAQVLGAANLTEQDLFDPNTRISPEQILTICQAVLEQPISTNFAFEAGCRVHITHLGMFGFACMAQPTMRATYQFAMKYRPLSAPMIGLKLIETVESCQLVFSPMYGVSRDSGIYAFILCFNFGMFYTLSSDALGEPLTVLALSLTSPATSAVQEIAQTMKAQLVERSDVDCMAIANPLVDRPLKLANPITLVHAEQTCDMLLSEFDAERKLIKYITNRLAINGREYVDLVTICSELRLNERTLRRRLAEAGTSFIDIRTAVKKNLACRYLLDTQMSVDDIAYLLGFSAPTNFRNAFKKWFHMTPKAYRHQQQELG